MSSGGRDPGARHGGDLTIRPMRPAEAEACERILHSLPDWFGIEEALVQYVRDLPLLETLVAVHDQTIDGFIAIRIHNPSSAEVHVMGVRPELHGRGIGRSLLVAAEASLRARSVAFLEVKTLGPGRPDVHYQRTRGFYERMGFLPLEENELWGAANPCLIMIKHLACAGRGGV
jgi:ribosomal protein S18 acetylase RimI-like enzyme